MDEHFKSRLKELKDKHRVLFPQIKDKSVHFTIKGHKIRYMYVFTDNEWGLVLGPETSESKLFMSDLIKAGIITHCGNANFEYGWG